MPGESGGSSPSLTTNKINNMATVYKVEVEVVSDWANYPEEQMSEMIKEAIKAIRISKIEVTDIQVVRTA